MLDENVLEKEINCVSNFKEFNDGTKSYISKFGGAKQSNFASNSPAGTARFGQQYNDQQQSTKSQLLHTAKAKKHKYIKKSLNPKLVKNVNKRIFFKITFHSPELTLY